MFRNIRWRIAIPYTTLLLTVMAGLTAYLSIWTRSNYLANLETKLAGDVRLLAETVRPALLAKAPREQIAADVNRYAELLEARITIIDTQGIVLADSQEKPEMMDNHLDRPEVSQALSKGIGNATRFSNTAGFEMMYAAAPIIADGQVIGIARVAVPLRAIQIHVARLRQTILLAALITGLFAIGLALLIAERTARPVRELTQVAGRLARGELDVRLLPTTRDEVGDLTQAFNQMASELRRDITTLAEERGRLAAVLEYMADGALITNANGRVELINPAASRFLDFPVGQAVGRTLAQVVRHHQLIELWRRCREYDTEQTDVIEVDRRGPFLQAVVTPFRQEGAKGYLVILQDLTQIRRLETVRRDFVSNISHELRTPLAALKALVDTLRDGALEDPSAAQRFLDRIETEVDAMTQMVQELLELSRIESRQAPLRLAPTPVAEIISPAVERLLPQAERAGLTVETEIATGLPPVEVDAERMRQVVTNLVHNAIKFTPAGGRVSIRAYQDPAATPAQPAIIVSVVDTGVGISHDDLPRIFERFYKADRARSGGGTGLGLAIAKHIVQAHGGRIWAESVEGKGSTFYFSLPAVNTTLTSPA